MSDGLGNVVTIGDLEPSALEALLRFLYTDNVSIDASNVVEVAFIGSRFLIPFLTAVRIMEISLLTSFNFPFRFYFNF